MSVLRKNTLVVDLSILPKRPDVGEVEKFLQDKVKLQLADVKTIQLHNIRNVVYIETIDSETALRYERANHYKHTIVCNAQEFKIPVYVESEAVTVRVHDLPTHTQHRTVTDFMGQFGVVLSIARERWKNFFTGYYNGVRVLRMQLSRPIPSCVTIDGETSLVTYRNQPKTCRHCGQSAHPKQKCAKRTTANNVKPSVAPSSARTTTPPTPSSTGPQLDGDEFPSLPQRSSETETQQNRNNKENNTTSDIGDDCDDDDNNDDNDDDDNDDSNDNDGEDDDDNSNDSADTNDFIEATSNKRRMSKRLLSKANEIKKQCVIQGSPNFDLNSNRFQPLVEIDPMYPSAAELDNYLSRSVGKHRKRNSST